MIHLPRFCLGKVYHAKIGQFSKRELPSLFPTDWLKFMMLEEFFFLFLKIAEHGLGPKRKRKVTIQSHRCLAEFAAALKD